MRPDNLMETRKPNRLNSFDYSNCGCYFITICTHDRVNHFGEILNGEMNLNDLGIIAKSIWQNIPEHFNDIVLDEFIVMPNHIHGIIGIVDDESNFKRVTHQRPLQKNDRSKMLIPKIVQQYKATVTREIKRKNQTGFKWQRSFYDHIIRNEKSFENIQEYIHYNPLKWDMDIENKINEHHDYVKYYSDIFTAK